MEFEIVLLAAGNSVRYGANKLLAQIQGKPMYRYALELAMAMWRDSITRHKSKARIRRITVISQYEEICRACTELAAQHLPIRYLHNDHSSEGIAGSIQLAVQDNGQEVLPILFLVCDQPYLRVETVWQLLDTYLQSGKGLGCAGYRDEKSGQLILGNPCIFSICYREQLKALQGDRGGKQIIRKHLEDTSILVVKDKRELTDIDQK